MMKTRSLPFKLALPFVSICLFLAPFFVQAQCPGEGLPGGFLLHNRPLVPCGRAYDCNGDNGTQPCTLCHLLVLINNIYNLLLSILIIVCLLFITVGGVMFIISAGNPGLRSMAKSIIVKTLTGFAIFLLSWLIVYTILVFISVNSSVLGSGGNWWQFRCGTTAP